MQTGHPSIATFHAATVSKLVQRLTNYPINIPKTHIDNLNAALFQSAVHDETTGRYKRRVLAINEILGYEPAEESYNFVEVFSFDPSKDRFDFRGQGTSYLLDSKIAVMRGFDAKDTNKIYDEMYQRAEILEYLIALNILGYQEVLENILATTRMGIAKANAYYRDKAVEKLGPKIEEDVRKKVRGES
jgi:archaeal flagellar protein FlaI